VQRDLVFEIPIDPNDVATAVVTLVLLLVQV